MTLPLDQATPDSALPTPEQVLEGLNDQQRAAVTHLGGPLLIVAGAGSGKTRTLTRRFEWLVAQGVPADRILALTYTNEAADELATRIESVLPGIGEEIHATTFHALCMEILRDEYAAAGLNPFFSVAQAGDRIAIMLARINELTFNELAVRGNAAGVIGELIELIDRLKEECISPRQLADYAAAAKLDAVDEDERKRAAVLAEQAQLYAQHERFLHDAAALDFGGMQYGLHKLLSENDAVRQRIARRFEHILVDEFQDTTHVQLEILRLLALDHGNIAAVGDDDQSIYGFRGASSGSIKHFEQRFGEHTEITLELNYRSAPPIIDAARAVVQPIDAGRRVPKNLVAADTERPGEVQFWHAASEVAEAQAIVAEIERLVGEQNVPLREICVLARARGHMRVIADRLGAHEIPYLLGDRDFYKRREVRIPLSWLKVLADPTLNEDAWRLVTAHPVNLDSADYAGLMRWMNKEKQPHVVEAMRTAARSRRFQPEVLDKTRQFVSLFDQFAGDFDELGPGEFMIRLINEIAIKGSVLLEGAGDAPDRLANLSKLQNMAEEYEMRTPGASARDFANYITGMAEADFSEASAAAERDPDAVRLMTAHGCKGLEFEYVFVPGMVATRWPGRASGDGAIPTSLINDPISIPENAEERRELHTEEIRRLAHVAMTRARTQLVLSWFEADKRGHKVSPFFGEAMLAVDGEEIEFPERDFEPADFVYGEMEQLRGRLMRSIQQSGAQLGEMRLDAHSETPREIARFAELIKLSALAHRMRHGETISQALPEINAMLTGQMSDAQRAEFKASELDERLLISEQRVEQLAGTFDEANPHLANFLPIRNNRLHLSASAIASYLRCPQQYAYDKVLGIPTAQPSHLRLGITVHNVLERFHRDLDEQLEPEAARNRLENLLDQAIATGGWGRTDDERQLIERARKMLSRYAESDFARPAGQVRTEVNFSLNLPPTELMEQKQVGGKLLDGIRINGKIDRIEKLPDGTTRVVDYKTGHDKGGPRKLRNFVAAETQLAIYKFAGAEALGVDAEALTYYFLENENPVIEAEASDEHVAAVRQQIDEVADRIISLDFTPDPSYEKCRVCPFRHVCPATEA